MYTPPAYKQDDPETLRVIMRQSRLATLVTAAAEGLLATPLPLFLDETEGPHGTLYGHLARANSQWSLPVLGEALVLFSGPDAYITPSWYATKQETGKVVPTWNYVAVHAYGPVEFFQDKNRLLDVVSRLTTLHEKDRAEPWAVADAPDSYIQAQLKGIVGIRLPIARLEGKLKMGQRDSAQDRLGVAKGLAESARAGDQAVAPLIPTGPR
ncbi:Protease synthase and sporulation protein PAI 2 [Devosia sp. LC5]|uniref:FMN-binding negative transcriptional regulator n=1 Tax=Devosia sp. LC5 TaxID=1502724 RepID=UPI0004E41DDC|nr:FMN-binding negative transcriptional regulator [Devosia sp. LC5]KFC61716.1 Protease synthase and sporulation protein PAI 2 [Devosia sp. LC5]